MLSAGLCWANQSSQCGRAGWDGALGVGVSQRPQAGETLGRRLSGASSQQDAQGRQHWGRSRRIQRLSVSVILEEKAVLPSAALSCFSSAGFVHLGEQSP